MSEKPIYIGPSGQSSKAIRDCPGHLPGLGRQLAEIDIEIRFIAQDFESLVDVKLSPLLAGGGDSITKIVQKVIFEVPIYSIRREQ